MIRLKLDLQSMTVEDKVTIGHSIADGLDAQKKKFSKPPVAPADLRSRATSLDAKRKARVAAKAALSKAVKEEHDEELLLDDHLRKEAAYAETADATQTELEAAGFTARAAPVRHVGGPSAPENFHLEVGAHPGQIRFVCKPVKGAVMYELERATSGDGPFSHADKFSKSHGALDDEKSSQKMWYRLAALATDDKRGEFCAPISIVVP